MKKKLLLIIPAVILLAGGLIICLWFYQYQHSEKFSSTEYSYQPVTKYFLTKDGLYYVKDQIAKYYDTDTEKDITLGSDSVDSYYENALSILIYNHKFYCITSDIEKSEKGYAKETLYECDCDGSNRKKLYDFPGGGVFSMYAYQGKLYYSFNYDEVDKSGNDMDNAATTSLLCVYDLKTNKSHTLYTLKQTGEQHGGGLFFCESDNREKIYCSYWYYDGNELDLSDPEYLKQYFRSTFLCYDLKSEKMTDCFTKVNPHTFVTHAAVYHNNLYCTQWNLDYENSITKLERYHESGGDGEVILTENGDTSTSLMNGIFYINNGTDDLLYNVKKEVCYQQTSKENLSVVAISPSDNYIALDAGDYSDLKNGDVYTSSRFKPEVRTMEKFLSSFQVYQGGTLGNVTYTPLKD